MSILRVNRMTIQVVAAAVLVAISAGVVSAQKSKPAGPPITTHGETKASASAAKGQANAESKRKDADADKAAKDADKKEDATERAAMKAAGRRPHELLKGIKLTKTEEKSVDEIEKKYDKQLKDLDKQEDAAEKAGKPDPSIASKIDALRTQEQAELRGVLTPDQAKRFDKNAAAIGSKK
jgi:hypothetical protein